MQTYSSAASLVLHSHQVIIFYSGTGNTSQFIILPKAQSFSYYCFCLFLVSGKEFPNSFESLVKKICRYLFHVLAHLYWAHFKETVALELQGHLNTLYAHFIVFVREFNLVDPKETCIMDDLSEILCAPAPLPALTPAPSATAPSPSSQNHVTERWAGGRWWNGSRGGVRRSDGEGQTARPWCKQDLRDLPLPLYFATTPTSRKKRGGGGIFQGGGLGWWVGEEFVTPAGIGVSVPPRDKFLPPSLQFKLGTKSMFYFFWFLFSFIFCWLFIFGLRGRCSVFVSTSPPSILCLTYSTGRGALLCFDLLLYSVVDVWRRGVSADLWACPSPLRQWEAADRRTATTLASREPCYCLTGAILANHCFGLFMWGMIKALPTQDLREYVTAARETLLIFILYPLFTRLLRQMSIVFNYNIVK